MRRLPSPTAGYVEVSRVKRENGGCWSARIVEQTPERVLPQPGIATPERGQLLPGQRGKRRCVPGHMPQSRGWIAADPLPVLPPAHRASQGGQLTVDGAGVGQGSTVGDRSGEPEPGAASSSNASGTTGGTAPRRNLPAGGRWPTSGQHQLVSEIL